MTISSRWSLTVAVVALTAGFAGPAFSAATPEQVTAALTKLLATDKGATFTLGTPTQSDAGVVYNNVSIKSSEGEETKIAVLTVGNPNVEGDTLSADSILAENITGTTDGDALAVASLELTAPVFTGTETGNRVDAVSVDGISVTKPGKTPVLIDNVALTFSDYTNDVPQAIDLSVEGIVVDPAALADENDQVAKQLKAMGYDKLTLGFYGSGSLDDASGDLVVKEITIDGTDLGTLRLTGTFGGLTADVVKQLKQPNPPQDAFGKITLKQASIYYGDASLAGRIIAEQAKQMGQEPAAFVGQITGALPLLLSSIGNQPFQDKLAQGVTTFLKDPQNLTISVEPAAPIPLMEVLATSQTAPQTLPDVLKADVMANQPETEDGEASEGTDTN
ncbi:hypothetical protein CXZ10_05355 [Pleomorphomonas diazotrophica]|uniref:DUF945 domain-containing protein n=1 Tax=Pleomorphomonas diazotrophica TaxID=1166257 RepID=A0A1I4QBS5_9HYPH|nr:hypothetical protein [Pleomorphomonas diazotrophica]PKR90781.1 hypothetical protein CXZ10_05355 [Pleomorphomonas diazotrophica]SFM37551.1 hypothetical protein SAMN05192571_101241 [Pleomorphomonas diazotrophica]